MRHLLFRSNCWNCQLFVVIWWIVLATCFSGSKAGDISYIRMTVLEDEIQTFSLWRAVLHCALENSKYTSGGRCSTIQWTLDRENGSSDQSTATNDFQETKTVSVAINENSDVYQIITDPEITVSHLQILRDEEFIRGRYSCTAICGPDTYTTTCKVTNFLHQNRSFLCAERMFPQPTRSSNTPNGESIIIDLPHLQTHSERKADPTPSLTSPRDVLLAISAPQSKAGGRSSAGLKITPHDVLAWSHGGISDTRPVSQANDKDDDEIDEEDRRKVSVAISFFGGCVVIVLLVTLTRWYVKRRANLKQMALGSVRWQPMDARSAAEDHSDDDRPCGSSDEETWEARPRRFCRGRPCLTRGASAGRLACVALVRDLSTENGLPNGLPQTAFHHGSERGNFSFPLLRESVQERPDAARTWGPVHRGSTGRDVCWMLRGSSTFSRPDARGVHGDVEITPLVADPSLEILHLPSYDESEAEALQGKSGTFAAAADSGRATAEDGQVVASFCQPENGHGAKCHHLHPRTTAANLIRIQVTCREEGGESFAALPSNVCHSSRTPGIGMILLAPAADSNLPPPPPYHSSATAVRRDVTANAVGSNIDAEQHNLALSRPPSYRTALDSQDGILHWHPGFRGCAVPVAFDHEGDNNTENSELPCSDNDGSGCREASVRR